MMGHREKLKGAAETQAFCKACRRKMKWSPGALMRVKRGANKRARAEAAAALNREQRSP